MAKGISKKSRVIEIVSTALEEYLPVNYVIVGRSEWIDGNFEPEALEGIRVVRVTDPHHLHRVKEWLDKHIRHFIDTESNSLNALDPTSKLLMMQIGNAELVFVIDPELIIEFKDHLEDPQYIHVFQNGIHDWKFFYTKYGIHINRFYDTMLSEQLLISGRSGMPVNLAAISRRRPPHRIITKAVRKKFIAFTGKFTKEMVYYAVRDVVLLPAIMDSQIVDLKRFNMEVIAEDEFNLIPVTSSMELGGVPFSTKTLRLALLYWQKRQDDLEKQILKLYDERITQKGTHTGFLLSDMKFEFDVNSQSQKLAALRELGFEIDDVKRETLEDLEDPIAELLGQYSEALKVNSTYGENMINRMDPVTGRLIVEFNQLGHGDVEAKAGKATTIATGRYSSDFQQLPRARTIHERVTGSELQHVQQAFATGINKILEETH